MEREDFLRLAEIERSVESQIEDEIQEREAVLNNPDKMVALNAPSEMKEEVTALKMLLIATEHRRTLYSNSC